MKTLIAVLTAASMLAIGTQRVRAHDEGWATAGKVLTGVFVGSAVAAALTPHPVYAAPPVVYTAPPPVVYSAPPAPVYYSAPAPVYVQPAPTVVYTVPGYCYPYRYYYGGPVIRFGWGGGHYYHHGHW